MKSAKIAAIARKAPNVAGTGRQSIRRPPSSPPTTMPTPSSASATGTDASASPVRSVRIGVM